MSFANPAFLELLPALLLLVALGWYGFARRRRRLGDALGGRTAARRLAGRDLHRFPAGRAGLVLGAVAAVGAALAGPGWRAPEVPPAPPAEPPILVLALDVSRSMQAADLEPTRLDRAREAARGVIAALPDARIGLLLFAGQAYHLTPPTADHRVLEFFLGGVEPGLVSDIDEGTLLSVALREGAGSVVRADSLRPSAGRGGARGVVLLTDGEANEPEAEVMRAAAAAAREGIRVYALGVGTARGTGLVQPDRPGQWGGPVLDEGGAPVVSRLRAPLLRRVAEVTDGRYAEAADASAVAEVAAALAPEAEPAPEIPAAPAWSRLDLPFWLTVAALALLVLESLVAVPSARRAGLPARRPA